MNEKKIRELRQSIYYKPPYKNRRYSLIQLMVEFFRSGKWRSARRTQMVNVGHQKVYRDLKKKTKAR